MTDILYIYTKYFSVDWSTSFPLYRRPWLRRFIHRPIEEQVPTSPLGVPTTYIYIQVHRKKLVNARNIPYACTLSPGRVNKYIQYIDNMCFECTPSLLSLCMYIYTYIYHSKPRAVHTAVYSATIAKCRNLRVGATTPPPPPQQKQRRQQHRTNTTEPNSNNNNNDPPTTPRLNSQ